VKVWLLVILNLANEASSHRKKSLFLPPVPAKTLGLIVSLIKLERVPTSQLARVYAQAIHNRTQNADSTS